MLHYVICLKFLIICFTRLVLVIILAFLGSPFCLAEIFRLPLCGKFDADFSKYYHGKKLTGHVLAILKSTDLDQCIFMCVQFPRCKTFNFLAKEDLCELNSKSLKEAGTKFESSLGWVYADTPVNQTKVGNFGHCENPFLYMRFTPTCNRKL